MPRKNLLFLDFRISSRHSHSIHCASFGIRVNFFILFTTVCFEWRNMRRESSGWDWIKLAWWLSGIRRVKNISTPFYILFTSAFCQPIFFYWENSAWKILTKYTYWNLKLLNEASPFTSLCIVTTGQSGFLFLPFLLRRPFLFTLGLSGNSVTLALASLKRNQVL